MTQATAAFRQSPNEVLRYVLDYTLDLDANETVLSIVPSVIPNPAAPVSPALVCTNVMVAPGGLQVIYYISGGADGFAYEVQFLAATSLSKTIEDVVQYNIRAKV